MASGGTEGEQCFTPTSIGKAFTSFNIMRKYFRKFSWTDLQTFMYLLSLIRFFLPCVQVPHTRYFRNPEYSTRGSFLPLPNLFCLNIDYIFKIANSQVEVPWPLYIEDNSGSSHTFVLKPGGFRWPAIFDQNFNIVCSKVRCFEQKSWKIVI